jgi:hypothetical protein
MADTILHSGVTIKHDTTKTYLDISDFIGIPKKTTTQILSFAPTKGFIVYNTTTNEFWIADGSVWRAIRPLEEYEQIIPLNFTTIDTTPINVIDIPMNNGDALTMKAELIGKLQSGNQVYAIDYMRSAVKQGGIITIIPMLNTRIIGNFVTNPVDNFVNNANLSVRFTVHSGMNQIINWKGKAIITKPNLP